MPVNELTDTEYISRLITNPHKDWKAVQEDLNEITEELSIQIKVVSAHKQQWQWTRSDETFLLATPASRVGILAKLLHKIEGTKQELTRLGVRSAITKLFYKELACPDRKKELDNEVQGSLRVMDSQIKQLAIVMEEIQTHMQRADNEFRTGPCATQAEQVNVLFRRAFEQISSEEKQKMEEKFHQLQIQLDSQSAEIARLKEEKDQAARTKERSEDAELNDDEYFEQMTREVTVDEDLPPLASEDSDEEEGGDQSPEEHQQISQRVEERPPRDELNAVEEEEVTDGEMEEMEEVESTDGETEETGSTDGEVEELEQRCRILERRMDRLHEAFMKYPYRKKEHYSPRMPPEMRCAFCFVLGEHFSDSCPNVIKAMDRYELLRDEGLCITCLERCSMFDDCPYLHKRCYYCERVRGTPFEDLIEDFEHHTAVCGIPDLKERARERLNAARRDFREAVVELNHARRRRRRQPREER
ncbi:hypothetical protein GCK32_022800, partial [Trichostrongylus colubriformis]